MSEAMLLYWVALPPVTLDRRSSTIVLCFSSDGNVACANCFNSALSPFLA